ncbi:PGF-CTERM sorting domain-containing protein, partial [Halorussus sp. GCM10023401]
PVSTGEAAESNEATKSNEVTASSEATEREALREMPAVTDAVSQNVTERWRRTYGGSGDDIFADVVRTDDGGYLLAGWKGGDDRDSWVVKVDAEGHRQWAKTFGGSGTDRFYGVAKTDSGYVLAGRTDREGGAKGWILELGPGGERRSERTPGPGAFYVLEADDSGYVLAGWTRGDGTEGWAMKLDRNGSRAWARSYAPPEGYDAGYVRDVVPANDSAGYYLAGKIEGDSDDAWALKVGADGAKAWSATAGGANRDDVWAAAPADSGLVVVGETESNSTGPRDGWLVKFDGDGTKAWERRHGGEGVQWLDSAMRTDSGYLFTGSSTAGPVGGADGYLLATDAEGNARASTYVGTDSWDKPWPHVRAHDGGYVLAGQTSGDGAAGKDGWLVRVGPFVSANGSGTAGAETTSGTTANALDGDTETATASGGTAGGVPGFGVAAALVALLAAALVGGRRIGRR